MGENRRLRVVYDAVLKRPGCVLLQAIGGTIDGKIFPSETWLLAPTPNMKVYEVTPEQLAQLVRMSETATG